MRDPERIERILTLIRRAWTECPDLRFVQLLWVYDILGVDDRFYLEDDIVEQILREQIHGE